MPEPRTIAAVDCGSTSTRLLLARVSADGAVTEVDRRAVVTRLGDRLAAGGRLDPAGVERTLGVLHDYRQAAEAAGAVEVRAVATAAARRAGDVDAFLAGAAQALGAPVLVVDGMEEARLTFEGAVAGVPAPGPYLVVDIGGGSTEFALGDGPGEVRALASTDIGAALVLEAWLHGDPPSAEELSMAVSVARAHVDEVLRLHPDIVEARTIVGVAATATTVAAVELGDDDPAAVHHLHLDRAQVEDVFRTLATEPLADRRHNPGLPADRAELIVGGCCILAAVLRHLDAPGLVVSRHDLLDGLAAG